MEVPLKGSNTIFPNSEEHWFAENEEEIFTCPHQPGALRISKTSCIQRYLLAKSGKMQKRGEQTRWVDIKVSFAQCDNCPTGKDLTKNVKKVKPKK